MAKKMRNACRICSRKFEDLVKVRLPYRKEDILACKDCSRDFTPIQIEELIKNHTVYGRFPKNLNSSANTKSMEVMGK